VFWVISVYYNIRNTLPKFCPFLLGHPVYVCMYVCITYVYVCMYVCMCVCIYASMCVCVCMYVCVYLCMYVYMYICVCMFLLTALWVGRSKNRVSISIRGKNFISCSVLPEVLWSPSSLFIYRVQGILHKELKRHRS